MKYEMNPHWHDGLFRAMNEDLSIQHMRYPPEYAQGGFECFVVSSSKLDGSVYLVQLHQQSRATHVICPCHAGKHGKPCKHGALVLYQANMLSLQLPATIDREEIAA